jgi:hypothetical protein
MFLKSAINIKKAFCISKQCLCIWRLPMEANFQIDNLLHDWHNMGTPHVSIVI